MAEETEGMEIDPQEHTQEEEEEYEPAGPRPIKKLSTDVINQIAAAEVRCSALSRQADVLTPCQFTIDYTPTFECHQGAR